MLSLAFLAIFFCIPHNPTGTLSVSSCVFCQQLERRNLWRGKCWITFPSRLILNMHKIKSPWTMINQCVAPVQFWNTTRSGKLSADTTEKEMWLFYALITASPFTPQAVSAAAVLWPSWVAAAYLAGMHIVIDPATRWIRGAVGYGFVSCTVTALLLLRKNISKKRLDCLSACVALWRTKLCDTMDALSVTVTWLPSESRGYSFNDRTTVLITATDVEFILFFGGLNCMKTDISDKPKPYQDRSHPCQHVKLLPWHFISFV